MHDSLLDNAQEFCRKNELWQEPESEELLRPGLAVKEYFRALMDRNCVMDANRVLAHAMPKRHALWWGLLCTWEALQPNVPENLAEVLGGVARFVVEPSEVRRREVEALAGLVRPETGSYCLAMGAFLSQGSMSEPHLPEVLPKSFLTGRLVGVAVYLAAVARKPLLYKDRLRNLLAIGLDVVRTPEPWIAPAGTSEPVHAIALPETPAPWQPLTAASI